MSKFLHAALHVIAFGIQIVNVSAVPAPYQIIVATGVSLIQGALALANHSPAPAAK